MTDPSRASVKLSPHFTLGEMTHTDVTKFHNYPNGPVVDNLIKLCSEILEPLRVEFGPIVILSGYRSPEVNSMVGGVKNSIHTRGLAADMRGVRTTLGKIWEYITQHDDLPFGQAIIYPTRGFIHIDHEAAGTGPRQLMVSREKGLYATWQGEEFT